MVEFSAGAVMGMLAIIEATIVTSILYISRHYASENQLESRLEKHVRDYHRYERIHDIDKDD